MTNWAALALRLRVQRSMLLQSLQRGRTSRYNVMLAGMPRPSVLQAASTRSSRRDAIGSQPSAEVPIRRNDAIYAAHLDQVVDSVIVISPLKRPVLVAAARELKMALTLLTYPGNFRAFKALIAAEYAGVEIAVKDVDAKAAAKLSPTGKVPVLETPQGTIFESNAIARYVARLRSDADLYGRTFYESAVHRSAQIKFRGAL